MKTSLAITVFCAIASGSVAAGFSAATPPPADDVENGVARTLAMNPCGVGVGRDAYFFVEVEPSEYPDSKITWAQAQTWGCDGEVEFTGPNGCTGRVVRVRGKTAGKAFLEVSVGGCRSHKPTFPLYVLENVERHINVWIAAEKDGSAPVRREENVRAMLSSVNDVYSQVAMTFVIDSVNVLRNPKSKRIYHYDSSTNELALADKQGLTFDELNALGGGSDINCFCIDGFLDSRKTNAATIRTLRQIVLSSGADAMTLAHELGHVLGARDIYTYKGDVDIFGEEFCYESASKDWSGGCMRGGSGYYRRGTMCSDIVTRLLMCGAAFERRGSDITLGSVYGVREIDEGHFEKAETSVGFPIHPDRRARQ